MALDDRDWIALLTVVICADILLLICDICLLTKCCRNKATRTRDRDPERCDEDGEPSTSIPLVQLSSPSQSDIPAEAEDSLGTTAEWGVSGQESPTDGPRLPSFAKEMSETRVAVSADALECVQHLVYTATTDFFECYVFNTSIDENFRKSANFRENALEDCVTRADSLFHGVIELLGIELPCEKTAITSEDQRPEEEEEEVSVPAGMSDDEILWAPSCCAFQLGCSPRLTCSPPCPDCTVKLEEAKRDMHLEDLMHATHLPIKASDVQYFVRAVVDDIFAMAQENLGAILIFNGTFPAFADAYFRDLSTTSARRVHNEPYTRGLLQEIINTRQADRPKLANVCVLGTDHEGSYPVNGATVIDLFPLAYKFGPWLHSTGSQLPVSGPDGTSHQVEQLADYGLRHQAAYYGSLHANAVVVALSRKHGTVTAFLEGTVTCGITREELQKRLWRKCVEGPSNQKWPPPSDGGSVDQFVNHITSDVFTMAMSRVGGTIIFNQKLPPLDDEYLQERSGHAKPLDVSPLTYFGNLSRLFDTKRAGHDCSALINLFHDGASHLRYYQDATFEPRICCTGIKLPMSPPDGQVFLAPVGLEGRGARHWSAYYGSLRTDAMIVVVSEERGTVTCFRRGEALEVGPEGLRTMLIGLIEEGLQNAASREAP